MQLFKISFSICRCKYSKLIYNTKSITEPLSSYNLAVSPDSSEGGFSSSQTVWFGCTSAKACSNLSL